MSMLDDLIIRDLFSARPAAGVYGRLFFASDTGAAYRDNGTTWDTITIASSPLATPGPFADDTAAAAGGVALGNQYYLLTSGYVVVRTV